MSIQALAKTAEYEIGGKVRTFTKLTLGILAQFSQVRSERRMRTCLKVLGKEASGAEKVECIKAMAYNTDYMRDLNDMQSPEGITLILYLAAKPYDDELTEEQVGDWLSLSNIEEVGTWIENVLLDANIDPETTTGESKNEAKAATG